GRGTDDGAHVRQQAPTEQADPACDEGGDRGDELSAHGQGGAGRPGGQGGGRGDDDGGRRPPVTEGRPQAGGRGDDGARHRAGDGLHEPGAPVAAQHLLDERGGDREPDDDGDAVDGAGEGDDGERGEPGQRDDDAGAGDD